MDTNEIIGHLERDGGMSGTSQVTTFKGYRENKAGDKVEITVEVRDAGESAGSSRYAVSAFSEDGKEAHGNEAGTLEEAIPIVHWDELG